MVNEITPTYYAANVETKNFEMHGAGFSAIPDDAVAVWAIDNNNPLAYRNTTENVQTFHIEVIDDNTLVCIPDAQYTHSVAVYIGAILTADRSEVLWVNNTQPLP